MSTYKAGTITLSNGSTAATGTGTAWLNNAKPGDTIHHGGFSGVVLSVNTNTSITLEQNWGGDSVAGAAYVINHTGSGWHSVIEMHERVVEIIDDMELFSSHVVDTNNPHGVTPGQIGALAASAVSAFMLTVLDDTSAAAARSTLGAAAIDAANDFGGQARWGTFSNTGASTGTLQNTGSLALLRDSSFNATTTGNHLRFYNPNGLVGSIITSASSTSFNTSSDVSLKENIEDADPAEMLDLFRQARARTFEWKASPGERHVGFIAQEMADLFPDAVTLAQDGPESSTAMIDFSKLVPPLWGAIQEMLRREDRIEEASRIILRYAVKDETSYSDDERHALAGIYPEWRAGQAVGVGTMRRHNGALYEAIQAHMTQSDWEPPDTPALWNVVLAAGADPNEPQPWTQPAGAHDAYALGAEVTHAGKTWVSNVADNVWEPGVFGWDEVAT